MQETELIELLRQGNQQAFSMLVNDFQRLVYNASLNILNNVSDAEDITQEVFVSVYQNIKTFKGESKLSTWMFRIAVTKSLELIRKRKTQKRFAFLTSIFQNEENPIDLRDWHHHGHPGSTLENKERTAHLYNAMDSLPENQRTSFILNKMNGLSYAEVAEVMQLSESAIESLLFRAKQNLQKALAAYYKQNEID